MKIKNRLYFIIATGALLIGIWVISISKNNFDNVGKSLSIDSVIKEKKAPLISEDSKTFRHSNSAQEIWDKQFNNNKPIEQASEDITLFPDGKIKSAIKSRLKNNLSSKSEM
jgi:hypothetical protein